ncbi:sulfatase [Carboxylicivirga sp. RSCT41]|uniref:sulfatase n=1 Tax=Carboxylicivirga agarovorans TaxID=3417570 RepID=UPI003D338281
MKNLFLRGVTILLFVVIYQLSQGQVKNVLLIAVDDLKPVGACYDMPEISTPHLDKLAASGFVFKNNHCQQAVCAPTRASLLTGRRPDYTRVWDLKTMIRHMNPDIISMPQYFKQNGYQTAAVGKVFDARSVDEGHDAVSWSIPYEGTKGSSVVGGGYMLEQRRVSTECADVHDSTTMDGRVLERGKHLLDAMAGNNEPFFLAVGFYKPHLPFAAPKKYWDLYQREDIVLPAFQQMPEGAPAYAGQPGWEVRSQYEDVPGDFNTPIPAEKQKELIHGYYACVSFIDQQIGDLLSYLDEKGLRENTIVVLWGDHGWHLGDHDIWCKHTNYEQATRSPLILSLGDKYVGQTHSPTEFIDVFPTVCDLAGLSQPGELEGQSLLPLLKKKETKVKDFAVSQFHRRGTLNGYAFRNERFRYVVWLKDKYRSDKPFTVELIEDEELYDYVNDREETVSLIHKEEYQNEIRQWRDKAAAFLNDRYKTYISE